MRKGKYPQYSKLFVAAGILSIILLFLLSAISMYWHPAPVTYIVLSPENQTFNISNGNVTMITVSDGNVTPLNDGQSL